MRITGPLLCMAILGVPGGSGCHREAPVTEVASPLQAEPADFLPAPGPAMAQGAALPAGPEPDPVEATPLPQWKPVLPEVTMETLDSARRQAEAALKQGRLYEDGEAAVPLYLAVLALKPGDAKATRGLEKARQQLRAQAIALMEQPDDQRQALAAAAERISVAVALAPEGEAERELQRQIQLARRILALNRAGESAVRRDQLGEAGGGALEYFRAVLALAPDDSRALQGIAAVQSGLIRRAEIAAERADFEAAAGFLARAATVRAGPTVQDARMRIEAMRQAQLQALRDGGLRDLAAPGGLKAARQKLEQALRIAAPGDAAVGVLRERIDLATHYGSFRPGQVFTDALQGGGRGPQMVVIPHGGFQMGATDSEPGASDAERPQHYVRFDRGFALSITEVTVAQFARFVSAANARPRATRRGHSVVYDERSGNFVRRSGVDWRSGYNGAPARPDSPVMHVSVRDAEAYATWLSEQTGRYYRLPTEAEFEYALRAGSSGRYPWGDAGTPPELSGNFTGSEDVSPSGRRWNNAFIGYGDGYWGAAPVASYKPNAWGVHDIGGNLSEWVADCWHASYRRAPADGAAWFNPGCRQRVIRGGNWANAPEQTRAAWRQSQDSDVTSARIGFRLVRGI